MSAATIGVRPVARPSATSDSEGSSGEEDTGRFKSAIVQAAPKEAESPSSSLSHTPSPLPHASFSNLPVPVAIQRRSSPSFPSQRSRGGWRSRDSPPRSHRHSHSPPQQRRDEPRREKRSRRNSRTPSPRHKEDGGNGELEEGEVVGESVKPQPKKKKEEPDPLFTRTGGAYIPPAKLRMMQSQIQDKSSAIYQRLAWEALKKSITGLINKVNVSNIGNIVQELFQENIVRGRGLLVRSVIQAQASSPTFTHVYAALVAIINTKFPQTGELLAKRLILQFKKGFRRNDKVVCVTASKFIAHLVNQMILHEIVALELLTLLLEEPTDDSVEVAVGFLKDIGKKLTEITPRGVLAVFETLRSVLHSKQVNSRVQYMIEVMFAVRKDKFQDYPAIGDGLDLVQEDDQITHLLSLSDNHDGDEMLNVFQEDNDYLANEDKYKEIKAEILGEGSSDSEESSGDESDDEDSEEEGEEGEGGAEGKIDITDKTDSKALTLRRTIYLTIMSSLDYEECAHKLMKTKEDGQEPEIAMMMVECCSQERSFLRFYGLLGQRFCLLNQVWVQAFDSLFQEQYATVHRLETNKLRNVAKFFAQLFYCDALPWTGMSCIHLNENETNSSSRIFVKILFQELAEFMGMVRLNDRLRDPLLSEAFEGLLPRDDPKNTRFAINFFTSIGLGGLTDDLREHLKDVQKQIMAQKQDVSSSDTSNSSSSDSEGSASDSSSEDDSSDESSDVSSSSEDSEEDRRKRRRQREKEKHSQRENDRGKRSEREREKREDKGAKEKGKDQRDKDRGRNREKRREKEDKERDKMDSSQNDEEVVRNSEKKKKERSRDKDKTTDEKTDRERSSRKREGDREQRKRQDRKERDRREKRRDRDMNSESEDEREEIRDERKERRREKDRGKERRRGDNIDEGRKRDRHGDSRRDRKTGDDHESRKEKREHERKSHSPRDKIRK